MAILMTAEVAGQTEQGYDGMLQALEPLVRAAPGFVLHAAGVVDGAWRVIEVWETKEQADAFFAAHVAPNLPPGVRPKRSTRPLHSLVLARD